MGGLMRRMLCVVLAALTANPLVLAQEDVWAPIRDVPNGSRVRVTMREKGTQVTGTLVELRRDAIVMKESAASQLHEFRLPPGASLRDAVPFASTDVAAVSLVQLFTRYTATVPPNAAIARRVVSDLGSRKNQKVEVKV